MRAPACEAALVGDLITTSPVSVSLTSSTCTARLNTNLVNPPTGKVMGHAAQSQPLFMECVG